MLKKISLDKSSYEDIYENAMRYIQERAPWWTHREASDPGITLLEMWSVLTDMQSFYMDQVQESHYRKYLKLLGIGPQEGKCASAWVSFENIKEDITLPRGTKLTADKMVFETEEEAVLTSNSLCGFFQKENKNKMDVMSLRRKTSFSLDNGELLFSFSLKKAVRAGEGLTFYVLLDEGGKRNPLGEGLSEQDFFLVRLAWEYRTAAGWKAARVVRDETRALLFSGCICLRTEEAMISRGDSGYEIRCRVAEGSYDVMPVIYKICLNVVRVIQKNTLCCYETAEFSPASHLVKMKSYLGKTGELRVLRRRPGNGQPEDRSLGSEEWRDQRLGPEEWRGQGLGPEEWQDRGLGPEEWQDQGLGSEGWRDQGLPPRELWQDITDKCVIAPPVTAVGEERGVYFSGEGAVKIVCTDSEAMSQYFPCHVSGVAAQRIELPWGNVMRESVELMLAQGGGGMYGLFRRMKEPEEECSEYAWHFREDGVIVLGDGRHGDIPPASERGLLPVSLALWEGGRGNVSIGRIKRWAKPELFPDLKFTNLLTGGGGKDRRSAKEQFQELAAHREQLTAENRMVTEEDIRRLVKKTPGLMIKNAQAEWKGGSIVVTVFPVKPLAGGACVEVYKRCIRKQLEQYRLVGSRIRVEIAGEE